jgi:hypothetical protein
MIELRFPRAKWRKSSASVRVFLTLSSMPLTALPSCRRSGLIVAICVSANVETSGARRSCEMKLNSSALRSFARAQFGDVSHVHELTTASCGKPRDSAAVELASRTSANASVTTTPLGSCSRSSSSASSVTRSSRWPASRAAHHCKRSRVGSVGAVNDNGYRAKLQSVKWGRKTAAGGNRFGFSTLLVTCTRSTKRELVRCYFVKCQTLSPGLTLKTHCSAASADAWITASNQITLIMRMQVCMPPTQ